MIRYRSECCQQVLVLIDRKRLDTTLIEMSGPIGIVMSMPTRHMRMGWPTKKIEQLLLGCRTDRSENRSFGGFCRLDSRANLDDWG
jgi:hypothetical protein